MTKKPPPRWERHQIVAAYVCGILAILYFTLQAVSEALWGVELDFWIIAGALAYIAALVVFNIRLPGWVRYLARVISKGAAEGDDDAEQP